MSNHFVGASILPISSDEDATPKPLRIVKRDNSSPRLVANLTSEEPEMVSNHLVSSTAMAGLTSSGSDKVPATSIHKSNKSAIPIRTSSILQCNRGNIVKPRRRPLVNKTGVECISPSPSDNETLRVRKNRKSDIRNSDTDAYSLLSEYRSPTYLLQRKTIRNFSHGRHRPLPEVGWSSPSLTDGRIGHSDGQANISETFKSQNSLATAGDQRGSSLRIRFPPSLKHDHRRIQSADSSHSSTYNLIQPYDVQLPKSASAGRLPSQLQLKESTSYKQRLFNKLASRFPSRATMSKAVIERNGYHRSSQQSLNDDDKENRVPGDKAKSIISSDRTETSISSDLHRAITTFPSPPMSVDTSATTNNSSDLEPRVTIPTLLSPVNHNNVIGATLTLIPEVDAIDTNGGKSIFVAIDVEGVINTSPSNCDSRLNVAVIVDNSEVSLEGLE